MTVMPCQCYVYAILCYEKYFPGCKLNDLIAVSAFFLYPPYLQGPPSSPRKPVTVTSPRLQWRFTDCAVTFAASQDRAYLDEGPWRIAAAIDFGQICTCNSPVNQYVYVSASQVLSTSLFSRAPSPARNCACWSLTKKLWVKG